MSYYRSSTCECEQDAALRLLSLSPKFSPIALAAKAMTALPPLALDGGVAMKSTTSQSFKRSSNTKIKPVRGMFQYQGSIVGESVPMKFVDRRPDAADGILMMKESILRHHMNAASGKRTTKKKKKIQGLSLIHI